MNSSWSGPDFAEDKIYKAMDNNGLKDRKAYYGSLVDCAKNVDGKFDAKSLTYGNIPKCFFPSQSYKFCLEVGNDNLSWK